MIRRLALLAVGVAAGSLGLALALVPDLGVGLSLSEGVSLVVGILAILAGLYRAASFVRGDADDYQLSHREVGRPVAVPGQEFDDLLADVPRTRVAGDGRWLRVRSDLRDAAVRVLTTYHGRSVEEAEQMLDEGTWTDDRIAAEFFTTLGGTGESLRESVVTSFGGQSPFHRRAHHATREIHRLAGGEDS